MLVILLDCLMKMKRFIASISFLGFHTSFIQYLKWLIHFLEIPNAKFSFRPQVVVNIAGEKGTNQFISGLAQNLRFRYANILFDKSMGLGGVGEKNHITTTHVGQQNSNSRLLF